MKQPWKQFQLFILTTTLCIALLSGGCGNTKTNNAPASGSPASEPSSEATESPSGKTESSSGKTESSSSKTETSSGTGESASAAPSYSEEDLKALDNTSLSWGQGVNFNDKNQPEGSLDYQKQYGSYGANFIGDHTDDKTIWLTIDEGYENGYTETILDVLKEKDCKAVFFITGPYAEQNPELVKRMISEGHMVGNHSWSHPSKGMPSLSIEEQIADITKLHDYVKEHFDYEMTLFRNPAGIFSKQSLAVTQSLGYRSLFWSFAYADWDPDDQPEQAKSLDKLAERLHPGALYLLHAVSATNTAILGDFIDQARSEGYTFELPSKAPPTNESYEWHP